MVPLSLTQTTRLSKLVRHLGFSVLSWEKLQYYFGEVRANQLAPPCLLGSFLIGGDSNVSLKDLWYEDRPYLAPAFAEAKVEEADQSGFLFFVDFIDVFAVVFSVSW